jgi:hypothetical protein
LIEGLQILRFKQIDRHAKSAADDVMTHPAANILLIEVDVSDEVELDRSRAVLSEVASA